MAYTLEKYTLPSNGMLDGVPKEVTIRNMTTAEEKMLLSSAEDVFDQIIKKCVTEPANFDIAKIPLMDKNFLYVKLRIISYGNKYKFEYRCPECGRTSSTTIDLDELEVEYLPEDFKDPFATVTLPICGDKLTLTLPRNDDYVKIRSRVRRFESKFPDAVGDESLIFGLMAFISEINGTPVDSKLHDYVSNLHVQDAGYLRHEINKLTAGIERETTVNCPKCHNDVEVPIPMGINFFHTDFSD